MKQFFKQSCPVCGRPLYVPVELLGGGASCSHCSGIFIANDQDANPRHASGKLWGNGEPPTCEPRSQNGVKLDGCSCFTCRVDALCESECS